MKEITIIIVCQDETVEAHYKDAKEQLADETTKSDDTTHTLWLVEPPMK